MSAGMGRVPFTVCLLPFTIRFYCIGLLNRNHGKKFWIGLYFRDLRVKLWRKRRKKLYLRTFNFCRLSTRKRLLLHQAGVQVCAQKISNKQLCPTSLKFEALSVKQKIRCFVQKWITTHCVWYRIWPQSHLTSIRFLVRHSRFLSIWAGFSGTM